MQSTLFPDPILRIPPPPPGARISRRAARRRRPLQEASLVGLLALGLSWGLAELVLAFRGF